MKKGKTETGFAFTLDENVFDDMELLEMLVGIDKGDATELPAVVARILGEDQKKKLYDHCRGEDGRVPVSRVGAEIAAIFAAFDKSKKS